MSIYFVGSAEARVVSTWNFPCSVFIYLVFCFDGIQLLWPFHVVSLFEIMWGSKASITRC